MNEKVGSDFLAEVDVWAKVMRQGRRVGQSNIMLVIRNGLGLVDGGGSGGTRWTHRLDELDGSLCRLSDFDRHLLRVEYLHQPYGESTTDSLKRSRKIKARKIRLPDGTQGLYLRDYEARLETALWRWENQLKDLVAKREKGI